MRTQFWLMASVFHNVVLAAGGYLLARWAEDLRTGRRTSAARLGAGLGAYASIVAAAAGVSCVVAGFSGFAFLRLVAQALFGETIVFALIAAWLHGRVQRRRGAVMLAGVAATLMALYWQAYHREPRDLVVSVHALDLSGGASHTRTLRIVHLSDIQTDRITDYEERALREAQRQEPDLVVLTGDYVQPRLVQDRARTTADFQHLLRRVRLRAPLGVYAVGGDVDVQWPEVLEGTGITPLSGETARIALPGGRWLSLVGLTVTMSRGTETAAMRQLLESTRGGEEDLRIVFGHNPNFVMDLAHAPRVDLALAGHTHGGQVVLPFLGPPITKTRVPRALASGLGYYGAIPLHVSRGIGLERGAAPQIRFLCRPEISVLNVSYAVGAGRPETRRAGL